MTRKFFVALSVAVIMIFAGSAIFAEAEKKVDSGGRSSQVTDVAVSIRPPTVIWVCGIQAPTHVEAAGGKDTIGIIDVYVCQPTYIIPEVKVTVGKVNAVSVLGAEGLLAVGRHRLIVEGVVPASVAKHTGVIKWHLKVVAFDQVGMPIQFVYGFPVWVASEVVKKR